MLRRASPSSKRAEAGVARDNEAEADVLELVRVGSIGAGDLSDDGASMGGDGTGAVPGGSSSSELSSSEAFGLSGTLFVPPLKKPCVVCRLFRRAGPLSVGICSSVTAPTVEFNELNNFFLGAVRGLYPAA